MEFAIAVYIGICIILSLIVAYCCCKLKQHRENYNTALEVIRSKNKSTVEKENATATYKSEYKKYFVFLTLTSVFSGLTVMQILFTFYNYCEFKNYIWFVSLFDNAGMLSYLLSGFAVVAAIVIAVVQYNLSVQLNRQSTIEEENAQKLQNAETVFREQQIASLVLDCYLTSKTQKTDKQNTKNNTKIKQKHKIPEFSNR